MRCVHDQADSHRLSGGALSRSASREMPGSTGTRSHGVGVQEVQAARDVQGYLVALAVPDELRALILVQRIPQVAPRHVLREAFRHQGWYRVGQGKCIAVGA